MQKVICKLCGSKNVSLLAANIYVDEVLKETSKTILKCESCKKIGCSEYSYDYRWVGEAIKKDVLDFLRKEGYSPVNSLVRLEYLFEDSAGGTTALKWLDNLHIYSSGNLDWLNSKLKAEYNPNPLCKEGYKAKDDIEIEETRLDKPNRMDIML